MGLEKRHAVRVGAALCIALALVSCDAGDAVPGGGAEVEIAVAPLKLDVVTDAVYTLTVTNDLDEVVWTRSGLRSTAFGDGAGSLSFVGPCDADANPNEIALVLEGLEDATGAVPDGDWVNPTPISRSFACEANADVSVVFDLTVLRNARQGFFDISVEFDDLFCSAKLDCLDGDDQPLRLLHDNVTGERAQTAVVGFACTAGAGQDTVLYLDDLTVTCADGVSYVVDPSGGPGNLGGASPGLFQAASYRGREGFGSVDKCYWNTALGIGEAFGDSCVLTATGTAAAAELAGLETPQGASWPLIEWNVTLTDGAGAPTCGRYAVNAGVEVQTTYTGVTGTHAFGHGLVCDDLSLLSPGPPSILNLGPSSGEAGDTVTITGVNFGGAIGTVTFDGVSAAIQSWSSDAVVATVPAGGGTGPVVVTTADGTPTTEDPWFARTESAPAEVGELNDGVSNYSIWDLDFDAAGNTYFAEYISGQDSINVVHGDGTRTTLGGNSNWNMGFVAARPDGTEVVTSYSWSSAPAIGVVNGSNFVDPVYNSSVTACSDFTVDGYRVCGPCDPHWGFDGYFYIANALTVGGISRFVAADLVAGSPPSVVSSGVGDYIVSLAMHPAGGMWAAADDSVYTVDKATGAMTLLATFAGQDVRSITASAFTGTLYAEVDGAIYEIAPSGTATLRYGGLTGSGFLVVGPDQQLYRVEGQVNAYSTITSYAP